MQKKVAEKTEFLTGENNTRVNFFYICDYLSVLFISYLLIFGNASAFTLSRNLGILDEKKRIVFFCVFGYTSCCS